MVPHVWFSIGKADLDAELRATNRLLRGIVATLKDILDRIGAWGTAWRDRALAAEELASAEKARADAAVAHVDAVIADDAAEDIAQLAAARAEAEALATAKADELEALDTPATNPPADPEAPADPEPEAPADPEAPVDPEVPAGEGA